MSRGRRVTFGLLLPLAVAASALTATASWSFAGSQSPARSGGSAAVRARSAPDGALTAVVMKSWGLCSSENLIWDGLNANWSSYGSIPISIDYSNPDLCENATVTLAALEASGADVVVLSDPAGGSHQFDSSEVTAITQYAQQGHNIIGTYLVFAYETIDNSALAPVFGLRSDGGYTRGTEIVTPTYSLRFPSLALFRDVGNPYVSSGYNKAQTPGDGAWSGNELQGARLVGRTSDAKGAITVQQPTASSTYSSIYISNMPEYLGGTTDAQFFYNAIIFPTTGA
jgi:hypothetical protein